MNFFAQRRLLPRWRISWIATVSALVLGTGVVSLLQKPKDWEHVFIPTALRLQAGEDIFGHGYVYPPFQALLAVPFSWLSPLAARTLWACLNSLAAAVFLIGAWHLTGGRGSPDAEDRNRREVWIFVFGLAAALGFLFDAITNAQTDLIIAAVMVGGCLLCARANWIGGAALIGLAAAAKCPPLLFTLWFAVRRRWTGAVTIVAVALIANLAADFIFPSPTGHFRMTEWAQHYPGAMLHKDYLPGTWATAPEFNHSLAGMFNRLLPAPWLRGAWATAAGLLLALAALTMARSRGDAAREAFIFEIGMVLTLMLLLSPVSSKPHFCILLVPAWALAREALNRRDRILGMVVVLTAVAGLAANKDLVGSAIYGRLKWSGLITMETLLLLFGCVCAHWRIVSCVRAAFATADAEGAARKHQAH